MADSNLWHCPYTNLQYIPSKLEIFLNAELHIKAQCKVEHSPLADKYKVSNKLFYQVYQNHNDYTLLLMKKVNNLTMNEEWFKIFTQHMNILLNSDKMTAQQKRKFLLDIENLF